MKKPGPYFLLFLFLRAPEMCIRDSVMAGRYSKDMILEAYVNIAPLTGTLSGMQAGAQQYFCLLYTSRCV